ncbi:MAG TPA: sigma-70 family RNA polymerase sigma factor [Solirubrobacteraceae bacterium]|nr:sigma-70 family RNA polymerase sigma factor [Solirubrobacteraceae bacterium]
MAEQAIPWASGEGSATRDRDRPAGASTGAPRRSTIGAPRREEANSRLVSQAIKRAQAGDREAMGFLYARYAENIYGYVRSIVHNHHEAEDITQHVFAKLMRVIGKYEEQDVPFLGWALRVARNVAVDHIRSERLIPVEELRKADRDEADPAIGASTRDLNDALAKLPSAQREVLILRHVAGLTPMEIARLTGKSEGSIHGLHHRGRRTLAAELASRGMSPTTMADRAQI